MTLQETYGCPDCADGGSGWVSVRDSAGERRSTFDFSGAPEILDPVDDFFRGVIETMQDCGSGALVSAADECVRPPTVDQRRSAPVTCHADVRNRARRVIARVMIHPWRQSHSQPMPASATSTIIAPPTRTTAALHIATAR